MFDVIGGLLCFSMYIAVFIQPFTWSFYTASVFLGVAAAGEHWGVVFLVSRASLRAASVCRGRKAA